jgi:hypothetical protein
MKIMNKVFLSVGLAIASIVSIPNNVEAQRDQYCTHRNGDRYYTEVFYEYGHGYPVVLNDAENIQSVSSYMEFTGEVTMYSYTEKRQVRMLNGEYVDIIGLWFQPDCRMQLLVFSPRLQLMGSVPGDTVAVPE